MKTQSDNKIKIKNHNLNQETVLEIGKFAILWSEFEKTQCNNNCSCEKIEEIARQYCASNAWQEFAKVLQSRIKNYGETVSNYVDSNLNPENAYAMNNACKEKVEQFINSEGKESLVGGLSAIYRIRNNMLHGLKELRELDGQIELFKSMCKVLEEL
jgi:hypothetical protein